LKYASVDGYRRLQYLKKKIGKSIKKCGNELGISAFVYFYENKEAILLQLFCEGWSCVLSFFSKLMQSFKETKNHRSHQGNAWCFHLL
jgi:hypothetical protein